MIECNSYDNFKIIIDVPTQVEASLSGGANNRDKFFYVT